MLCHHFVKFGTYRYLSSRDIMFLVKKNKTNVNKENRYQENIISKIFKRIINNHSLSHSQKTNASHIYRSRRDQNEYKIYDTLKVQVKNYDVFSNHINIHSVHVEALCVNYFNFDLRQTQQKNIHGRQCQSKSIILISNMAP